MVVLVFDFNPSGKLLNLIDLVVGLSDKHSKCLFSKYRILELCDFLFVDLCFHISI